MGIQPEGIAQLVPQAAEHARRFFDEYQDTRLVFHNYQLAHRTAELLEEIVKADDIPEAEGVMAGIAAWFLPMGYALDYRTPLKRSLEELGHFFAQHPCPEALRRGTVQTLETIGKQQLPASAPERLLYDAYHIACYIDNFAVRLDLLQLEWRLVEHRTFNKVDWLNLCLDQMLAIRLQKRHAKLTYEPQLIQHILSLQASLEKAERKEAPAIATGKFQYFGQPEVLRNAQAFFRTNYRNHINLSAIADNKANIMISVNAILISVLISFISYRQASFTNPMLLLPVVLFLVTGLASLIFAVLSARPKVTMLNNRPGLSANEIQRNLVFFGNFVSLREEEFEAAMDGLFRDSELYFGNLTRDLFHLGQVLDKKYRYLTASYNIFMVGFIATVATFIWVLF